jgi:hypothetical protein
MNNDDVSHVAQGIVTLASYDVDSFATVTQHICCLQKTLEHDGFIALWCDFPAEQRIDLFVGIPSHTTSFVVGNGCDLCVLRAQFNGAGVEISLVKTTCLDHWDVQPGAILRRMQSATDDFCSEVHASALIADDVTQPYEACVES